MGGGKRVGGKFIDTVFAVKDSSSVEVCGPTGVYLVVNRLTLNHFQRESLPSKRTH